MLQQSVPAPRDWTGESALQFHMQVTATANPFEKKLTEFPERSRSLETPAEDYDANNLFISQSTLSTA